MIGWTYRAVQGTDGTMTVKEVGVNRRGNPDGFSEPFLHGESVEELIRIHERIVADLKRKPEALPIRKLMGTKKKTLGYEREQNLEGMFTFNLQMKLPSYEDMALLSEAQYKDVLAALEVDLTPLAEAIARVKE